jgi:uncharacterized membrane protein YheB (UPF0754 family)
LELSFLKQQEDTKERLISIWEHMNEKYELNKIVKIGAKVGGVWGFVNGLFLILAP